MLVTVQRNTQTCIRQGELYLSHLMKLFVKCLLTKGCMITSKGKESIISGIWCDFDVTGYIHTNMDTMDWVYTIKLGYISLKYVQ